MLSRRNKPRNVGDIHHHQRADLVADGANLLEINRARVRRCAGDNHLWLALQRQRAHGVIINIALRIHAVRHKMEVLAGQVDRAAVREMTAV